MIFAHTLQSILSCSKTQTRRLIKPGEILTSRPSSSGMSLCVQIPGKRTVYEVGKSYAVQPGRGKKAVARITITAIRCETVAEISPADAVAEGFASPAAFLETWRSIHGKHANLCQEVWVLEFKLETIANIDQDRHHGHAADPCTHHCDDLPTSVARIPRTDLHSGHYPIG